MVWYFETGNPPYLENRIPAPGALEQPRNTLISFDVLDGESYVDSYDAYVDGALAWDSSAGIFLPPYDGPGSSVASVSSGGADGYRIVLGLSGLYDFGSLVEVRVAANDAGGNLLDEVWSFAITDGNFIYYSNGNGVWRIRMSDLAGESQDAAVRILAADQVPALGTNDVTTLSGQEKGGNMYLLTSMKSPGGVLVTRNEVNDPRYYLGGYDAYGAQMTPDGIMYVINRTLNRIEVYYGADFRPGGREPDFVYDAFSSPAIVDGVLQDIHIAPGYSDARSGSTRLYVSSTTGFARVDTYEVESADGHSAGMDGHGLSWTYGVRGSGKDYEAVGHPTDPSTPSQVIAIHSDEEEGVIFAVTNDGSGRGGLTQISISGNRRILFMDKDTGLLPSNFLRDVYGKI